MAQKTAMQALVELMKINDIYKPCMPYLMEIIDEVYLPMEKEQIIKTYNDAMNKMDYFIQPEPAEQYYNETFSA